jgi:adenine-specific DNA-methyltransferase
MTKNSNNLYQTPIENYTHEQSTRANIPTQEMSHLSDKKQEKKTYAYDPSLDPQLVWAGKEEKNSLEIDTTPLYIHEFISPK